MSKIEVDAITEQSGTTLTTGGGAGKTVVVDATTVTLGRCGGTVALASGASQTGFGRTGTVDWQTSSIKTATFTAANGEGYFCNTTSGGFTVNLPAGSAGAIVSVQDYNNTFDSNSLTVAPNGSEKINGGSAGGTIILNTEGEGLTLVYIDGTVGWRSIQDSAFADQGSSFICASVSGSGNTLTTVDTDYKIAKFVGPGTFTVNSIGLGTVGTNVDYTVVGGAGSGGGGSGLGGGGGAGGFRESKNACVSGSWTASPLATPTSMPVAAQGYPIAVGGGGAGVPNGTRGNSGSVSTFSTITSAGGGGAGGGPGAPNLAGIAGASGGGGGENGGCLGASGAGNTPPVSPPQGNAGGAGNSAPSYYGGGGGGGSSTAGQTAGPPSNGGGGGDGGQGQTNTIDGTPVSRAGGGGGSGYGGPGGAPTPGAAGDGKAGGGNGTNNKVPQVATAGAANRGSGGGGGVDTSPAEGAGAAGGSGIVLIRYKFQ